MNPREAAKEGALLRLRPIMMNPLPAGAGHSKLTVDIVNFRPP